MKTSRSLIHSYLNAQTGIINVLSRQRNFIIEITIAILVIAAGFILNISIDEWCIVLVCIAMVLSLEAVNTAIEKMGDAVKPGYHPLVGKAKDVAAGAVLIASIFSGIIGILIFVPKIFILIK